MAYNFNVEEQYDKIISFIQNWVSENGDDKTRVVIGISGGCDSTVTAGLLCKALGKNRVIGVMMPDGDQKDISDSKEVIEHLGIRSYTVNIANAKKALYDAAVEPLGLTSDEVNLTVQATTNTPARIRMTTLYFIAAQIGNCRVVNTCNMSEDMVGYSTLWGDSVGDFAPISHYTKTEVRELGHYIGMPSHLVDKTPIDGMSLNKDGSYKADEDKIGMTYKEIDEFIRGESDKNEEKIMKLHNSSKFKLSLIRLPYYDPELPINEKLEVYQR